MGDSVMRAGLAERAEMRREALAAKKVRAYEAKLEGESCSAVASRLKVSYATVKQWWKEWK